MDRSISTGPTARRSDPLADLAGMDGVGSAVAAARAGLDAVVRDRGIRRFDERRRALLAELGARGEARLVGRTDDDATVAAGLRTAVELPGLSGDVLRTPSQVLARIHTVWARGTVPDERLGRVSVASGRLTALTDLLSAPTRAPGAVLAAVAHAELVAIAPFGSESGPVARWVERAVLAATGTDVTGLAPMQAAHADRDDYTAALQAYGSGTASGVRVWLLYAAAALSDAAELMSTVR